MASQRRMRCGDPSPHQKKKLVKQAWRKKIHWSYYDRSGHQRATCWMLDLEQCLKDKVSIYEPVETIVRQASAPHGDDPFTLISERGFF